MYLTLSSVFKYVNHVVSCWCFLFFIFFLSKSVLIKIKNLKLIYIFSSFLGREADEGCKKPLERLLNIWQERSVYGGEFIQQLKLSMEDSKSPPPKGRDITTCLQLLVFAYFRIKYEKLQWGLLWTTSDCMILQREMLINDGENLHSACSV